MRGAPNVDTEQLGGELRTERIGQPPGKALFRCKTLWASGPSSAACQLVTVITEPGKRDFILASSPPSFCRAVSGGQQQQQHARKRMHSFSTE